MASYLITGASRGIGLELTKQLLDLPQTQVGKVFALTRSQSLAIESLKTQHAGRLVNVLAEVTQQESIRKVVQEVESALGGEGLDVLVNNAGILPKSAKAVENVDPTQLTEVFNVNVLSVQVVTSAFLPLLKKGTAKKVINVSSTLGSTAWAAQHPMAAAHAYRVSKAAMDMLNSLYAGEHMDEGFTFLLLSPGWLKTDLGSSYADLEPEVGVADVKRIILEANPSQNGKFLNIRVPGWDKYDGAEVPF